MKRLLLMCFSFLVTAFLVGSSGCSHKKEKVKSVKVVFDISTLIGKDIDGVRAALGTPPPEGEPEPTKEAAKLKPESWDNLFEKDGQMLLISFNPQNRKVIDFFLGTDDPSGVTGNYTDLMKMCNVKKGDSRYSIVPVRATDDEANFTGIRIVGR